MTYYLQSDPKKKFAHAPKGDSRRSAASYSYCSILCTKRGRTDITWNIAVLGGPDESVVSLKKFLKMPGSEL